MDLRSAGLLFCLPTLCSAALAAEGSPWWDPAWHFRTTVTRPAPSHDASPRPVEVVIDFPALLAKAGVAGEFDPASLRVVDPRNATPLPFASCKTSGSTAGTGTRLAWMDTPHAGSPGSYDIYFDTTDRRHAAPAFAADRLPPENLLGDPDFEGVAGASGTGWSASPAALARPGTFAHTSGRQSLCIRLDESTPPNVGREVTVTQTVDVRRYAGQEMVFEADLMAERAAYGAPVCIELRQFRADGSRLAECAVEPRWLALELAAGQWVQFQQRGRFSHEAATVTVAVRLRLTVNDADTGQAVTGPESFFTVWLDRLTLRPGERWPWPALTHAGYVEGALPGAPVSRAFEFTGQRRLMFNGASEGTLTGNDAGRPSSVHWGLERGTLEFWCRPAWSADDGKEHVFFEGIAYMHRPQSRLRKLPNGELEFCLWDSAGKAHGVAGPATFRAGEWQHVAATWDLPGGRLQLFAAGKALAAGGGEGAPWPCSLTEANDAIKDGRGIGENDRRTLPMQAFIGGDKTWQAGTAAEAAIDEFRISDTVRYTAAFAPAAQGFVVDPQTRALFHFDDACHGEHDDDDRFVRGHLACELEPQEESVALDVRTGETVERRQVLVLPHAQAEAFAANRAETRLPARRPFLTPPDPRFVACREQRVERVVRAGDAGFVLEVAGDYEPWMRGTTFEPSAAEAADTLLPRWRANDNPVPFSVADLAATLAPGAKTDAEKAFAAFRYALETTNYFDAHYCETLPGGRHRPRVSYTLIKALNIYPMDQCGPMNHMLRKLFLAAGLSSTDASGTHHQFEQAFYDGDMRLFDLSSRIYWLDRDNASVISRRDLEEDPYLKVRQGGDANAWLRGRRGQAGLGSAERPHCMDFRLRAGEKVSVCWHNEGRWFELTEDRKPIPLAKIPPYFGNGAVVLQPVPASTAQTLDNVTVESANGTTVLRVQGPARAGSFVYRAQCPYIFSGGQVEGAYRAERPEAVRLALSFDDGQTWQSLWASPDTQGSFSLDTRDLVSARYGYAVKLDLAPGAVITGLRVRSTFVVSPWSLPGRLARGANRITFVGGPVTVPVKTACAWIERHRSDLGVSLNALSFYLDSDRMHRHVCIVPPGEALPLRVTLSGRLPGGAPPKADRAGLVTLDRLPRGWSVQAVPGTDPAVAGFAVQPGEVREGDVATLDVRIAEADTERRVPLTVLCAEAPLAAEAEAATRLAGAAAVTGLPEASGAQVVTFSGDGQLTFAVDAARAGRHALWLRARWDQDSSTAMELRLDGAPARALRATAMIGFSDWTEPSRAHTKMFAHYGEDFAHWSWYRVPGIDLAAGAHELTLAARKGAQLDAVLLLPQNEAVDRAAMNLFMNWNYAPWRNPL
mgnify:CR=1 FL=1